MADTRLKDTRVGINNTEEEFASIIDTVKPLLKAGLGLDAIWCAYKDELGISKRTFYRWADLGLGICNLELPKKVAYRLRKKKHAEPAAVCQGLSNRGDWDAGDGMSVPVCRNSWARENKSPVLSRAFENFELNLK
jgi:hypothetical protein